MKGLTVVNPSAREMMKTVVEGFEGGGELAKGLTVVNPWLWWWMDGG